MITSQIKIDSLKLTFPRNMVQIVDNKFAKEYQKIYVDTGEIDDKTVSLDKHKVDLVKGISSRIALGQWIMGSNISEVVFIQINAKMLRDKYFEGITLNNWKMVYDHIINQQIIYIDERAFLTGWISDIDFAFDFTAKPDELKEVISLLHKKVLPNRYKYVDKPYLRKTNVGIMFNKRAKATPSKPFVKIYHKGLELLYKSDEFGREFLQEIDFKNTARLEVTFKNTRDKKYHGLNNFKEFRDLLELPQKTLEKIVFKAIPQYIMIQEKIQITEEVSPTDRYIIWLINILMKHGYGAAMLHQGLDIFDDKQQKHRVKRKLEKILKEVPDQHLLKKNKRIEGILEQLRIV